MIARNMIKTPWIKPDVGLLYISLQVHLIPCKCTSLPTVLCANRTVSEPEQKQLGVEKSSACRCAPAPSEEA